MFVCYSNVIGFFFVGCWVRGAPLNIPVWKMDSKRFEKVHARALARRGPLVPQVTTDVPSSSQEQVVVVADRHQSVRPLHQRSLLGRRGKLPVPQRPFPPKGRL